jgi:hypothetical protein
MESEARDFIKKTSRNSLEVIADKLNEGDLEYFIEHAPLNDKLQVFSALTREEAHTVPYATIIEEALASNGEPVNIPRRHIELLFFHLGDQHFRAVGRFTSFAGHKGLEIKPIRYGTEICQGLLGVKWNVTDKARELWEARKPKEHKQTAEVVPITSAKAKHEPADSPHKLMRLLKINGLLVWEQ